MTEFINMWKNYANFSDRTTVRGYWMAYLFNFLSAMVLGIVLGILSAVSGATGIVFLAYIYSLAVLVPSLAIIVRRLRDAGRPWYHIFFACIPAAGPIILIVFMCQQSAPDNGTPVV